jgi:hypothetical protein
MLIGLTFSNRLEPGDGEPRATPAQFVDLFLHGALQRD